MKILRFSSYIKTQALVLIAIIVTLIILILFMLVFHVSGAIIILFIISTIITTGICLAIDFYRRHKFYRELLERIAQLDQAYLALEMLECPKFYDGQILYEAFLKTNKSMLEQVEKYHQEAQDFEDYIELWIHEAKTPLAALTLISDDRRISEQLKSLDSLVEQVLYYARAKNSEQDYLVKEYQLSQIVDNVVVRNQPLLLAKKIKIATSNVDQEVYTDAKWCEFMIDQVLSNSIKYGSSNIKIVAEETKKTIILRIVDNGVGIKAKDLPRVFEKSFTGENGHKILNNNTPRSTGLGLYIVKQLCNKLGHKVSIESTINRGTTITFEFFKHDYYEVVDRTNLTKK